MGAMASQFTSITIVYSTVYSGADQRKHQSSESLAFVRGIHRWPVNSPHKWPVARKMLPFDDVIMKLRICKIITNVNNDTDTMVSLSCYQLTYVMGLQFQTSWINTFWLSWNMRHHNLETRLTLLTLYYRNPPVVGSTPSSFTSLRTSDMEL